MPLWLRRSGLGERRDGKLYTLGRRLLRRSHWMSALGIQYLLVRRDPLRHGENLKAPVRDLLQLGKLLRLQLRLNTDRCLHVLCLSSRPRHLQNSRCRLRRVERCCRGHSLGENLQHLNALRRLDLDVLGLRVSCGI